MRVNVLPEEFCSAPARPLAPGKFPGNLSSNAAVVDTAGKKDPGDQRTLGAICLALSCLKNYSPEYEPLNIASLLSLWLYTILDTRISVRLSVRPSFSLRHF